jgi:hypothetical protein
MTFRAVPRLTSLVALTTAALLPSACDSAGEEPTPAGSSAGSGGVASVAGSSSIGGGQAGAAAGGSSAGVGVAGLGVAGLGGTTGAAGSATTGGVSTGGSATGGATGECIVCDDFESSSTGPDPAKWTIDSSRMVGTATIDSVGARGSAKSLKVSGGYLKIDTKAGLFASVSPSFWVRLNMRFDIAQPSDHVTYLMFTDAAKMGELRVGAQNLGMIWNYSTNDTILPDYNEAASSLKPTPMAWHCFEFQFDAAAPALHVWMDGEETPKMLFDAMPTSGIDDRWIRDMPGWKPQITNFSFGSGDPTAGKVTTWYDDIAISNTRPGCTF